MRTTPFARWIAVVVLVCACPVSATAGSRQNQKQTQRAQQGDAKSGKSSGASSSTDRSVAVFGEVAKSGVVPLTAGMKLKDAISAAGGFAATADLEKVNLRRLSHKEVAIINGARALEGDPIQNATLEPGDTIYVPRKADSAPPVKPETPPQQQPQSSPPAISAPAQTTEMKPANNEPRVVILGAVVRPGTYLYEKATVRQAIDALGGPTPDAEPTKITLYRNMLNGPSVLVKKQFDYRRVSAGKAPDVELMPGDVVEVPTKGGRHDFFTQTGNGIRTLGAAMGRVITTQTLIGALPVVGPLLASPGYRQPAAAPVTTTVPTSQPGILSSAPQASALESALLLSVSSENPEVRDRIITRTRLLLGTRK